MQADRHARLRELFDSAIKLDSDSRQSFIEEACGGDAEMRGQLESLLRSVEAASADGELLSDRRIDRQRARLDGMLALDTAGREGCQGQDAGATVTGSASPGDRPALAALPQTIGQYRIKRAIASGGMGTVYEAEQQNPRRTVALKVIRQGLPTPALLRRFELESQVLGRLQHPGIAQIYEAGTAETDAGPRPFFAMEFVRGVDLRRYVDDKQLGARERLELIARICDAVHHAHQKGVIHRDLKPANILVAEGDQEGLRTEDSGLSKQKPGGSFHSVLSPQHSVLSSAQPKILDFGVARATDSDMQVTTMQTDVGLLIGTIQYMSPEQVAADPNEIDTRSDVYALGVITYEILTGRPPYDLTNKMIHEAARIIREEEPASPSATHRNFRGDIETIVAKALQKEKTRRYQSAAELAEDIRRYLQNEPITARPPSTWYNLSKFTRRNKTLVGGVAMTIVALVGGVIASTTFGIRAEAQARKASREAEKANRTANFATAMFEGLTPDEAKGKDTTLLRGILDEAAARIDKELGDEPEIEAMMRDHIGTVYRKLALFDDADHHLPKSLAIRRQVLGDLNSQTLSTMGRVAHLRLSQGREKEAIALFREAYAGSCEIEGRESGMAISHLANLGAVMRDLERHDEAHTYLREAVDLANAHLPPEDYIRISAQFNLVTVLNALERYDEAERECRGNLEIGRAVLGNESEHTLTALSTLSVILSNTGKFEESLPIAKEALDQRRRIMGDDHTDTLRSVFNYGNNLMKLERFEEARSLMEEALDGHRRLKGPDHAHTLYIESTCAILYAELGLVEQAQSMAKDALERARAGLGEDDPRVGRMFGAYGFALIHAKRYEEAESALLESHKRLESVYGAEHINTRGVVRYLALLHKRWHETGLDGGHDIQAAEWQAKLDAAAP